MSLNFGVLFNYVNLKHFIFLLNIYFYLINKRKIWYFKYKIKIVLKCLKCRITQYIKYYLFYNYYYEHDIIHSYFYFSDI